MKTKKPKHLEDVINKYLELLDEQIELPLLLQKANEKYNQHITDHNYVYKPAEADNMFKIFAQIKKFEKSKARVNNQIAKVESTLQDFLSFLKGGKIAYEKKNDDKSKTTFLFWLEDGKVMCNR